ncbi:MAG: hypothetical protein NT113_04745 [Hyphomicrobiales bacterium]|nr:hypothetical protein [Hyphomicrobiales bacterium]
MKHVTNRSWTEADIERLRELSAKGASITRAAAALNRKTASVAKMARTHGIQLAGTRQLRAAIKALDEKDASRSGQ